ncbi:hypothetical protein [Candidatus Venteria ishoeyi]|uniref:Chromosome partition protein Smc n=1 Tax=Candidatus Venteria ishoeyi TaxID=1899563 RepID=A0A1H6F7Y2_9GAMM|nr:hypothetical protein [Candidatus Venteria ishoeyi]SEH05174.1 Chromosome partition protein Smc [Candidatus Venteria ishoeyi]
MGIQKGMLNTFLMGLIVILLIGIIGVTVFFQGTIKEANEKFEHKTLQLELTKEELQFQLNEFQKLNSTYLNLNSDLESYTTEFEQVYSSCSEENDAIAKQLNETKSKLFTATGQIYQLKTDGKRLNQDVKNIMNHMKVVEEENLDDLSDQIDEIVSANENIDKKIDEYEDSEIIVSCDNTIDNIDSYSNDIEDSVDTTESRVTNLEDLFEKTYVDLDEVILKLSKY